LHRRGLSARGRTQTGLCASYSELFFAPFVFFVVDYVFFFGCGSAALGLCGEYSFTVNPEEV
jgi:hypothetical protein